MQHCCGFLFSTEAGKENGAFVFAPIGRIRTAFPSKNATPRQACICSQSSATLSIDKEVFNRPQHCLDGLEEFSHVWLASSFCSRRRRASAACMQKILLQRPPRALLSPFPLKRVDLGHGYELLFRRHYDAIVAFAMIACPSSVC